MVLLTLIAGTWIISLALTEASLPFDLGTKLRKYFRVFECFICCSFYVSILLCIAFNHLEWIFIVWAVPNVLERILNAYVAKG